MLPHSDQDYHSLLTEIIKKQILILGHDIVMAKVRKVKGLSVGQDGTVLETAGKANEILQKLVEEFTHLSKPLVQKTIDPLLPDKSAFLAPDDKPLDSDHLLSRHKIHPSLSPQEITPETTNTKKISS
jgi:hypothetical protein